jgi:AcrR family transcriptional regulator
MTEASKPAGPVKRRSQAERSDAMRKRLLQATLKSLLRDGYAGASVSKIVARAGVSRGAHVHHYPSKQALLVDAAADVMREAYRRLGVVMLEMTTAEDRLQAMVEHSWKDVFATSVNQIFLELLVASRRDKLLAQALHRLSGGTFQAIDLAAHHYFESADPEIADVHPLFMLNQWLMRGMALDLMLTDDPKHMDPYIKVWGKLLASHVKPRENVTTRPPRPADWDLHVAEEVGGMQRRAPRKSAAEKKAVPVKKPRRRAAAKPA